MLAFAAFGPSEYMMAVLGFAAAMAVFSIWWYSKTFRAFERIEQCHAMLTELVEANRKTP
jgi:hypothetical protein